MIFLPFTILVLVAAMLFGLGWNASDHAIHPGPPSYAWQLVDYPNLGAEDLVVEGTSGARLTGRLFRGRTKATVVLVHGYGGNQDEMLPIAESLHDAGFTVFTYDQRGCGGSSGDITFGAREQDDLISVVDHLVTRSDVDAEKIGVFGFSMGGASTILAAARDQRIKAVVADSAWSDVRRWLRPSVRDVFVHPRDPFSALSLKLAEHRIGIDLDALRPVDAIARLSPRPILLIHGTADEAVWPAESERNFEAAANPKELVLVPDVEHGGTVAPGGASTDRQVRDFFAHALHAGRTVAA